MLPWYSQNPSPVPNPEQTASVLSLVFYYFTWETIERASGSPESPMDTLPAIADYDIARNLVEQSFKVLLSPSIPGV